MKVQTHPPLSEKLPYCVVPLKMFGKTQAGALFLLAHLACLSSQQTTLISPENIKSRIYKKTSVKEDDFQEHDFFGNVRYGESRRKVLLKYSGRKVNKTEGYKDIADCVPF